MIKSKLKYLAISLLFISIVATSVFGFHFYDFGYNSQSKTWFTEWTTVLNGVFEENAININKRLGGGTSVYLTFTNSEDVTAEDYQITANTLKDRFVAMGYSDAETEVVENQIRVDIAQKTYIDSIISNIASVGNWSFVGSSMTQTLCDTSMIESAEVATTMNGTYGVTITFTEEGAKKFNENTASYASTSSSFYLMVDGQLMAIASVPAGGIDRTFSFGNFKDKQSPAMIASFINSDALPSAVEIVKTEDLAPTLSLGVRTTLYIVLCSIVVLLLVILIIKGKMHGIFAALAIISNIAVMASAAANNSFILDENNNAPLAFSITPITLLGITILFSLSVLLYLYVIKNIKAHNLKGLNKATVKSIILHAAIFVVSLLFWVFTSGTILLLTRIAVVFSVSNFILYFLFFYFGTHTSLKQEK